jgi:hypothetical protein
MSGFELGARFRWGTALAVALSCAACSLSMPYLSTGSHNMRITTATDAGAPLAATRAWLEVQRVAPDCHGEVEGELYLRGPVDSLYLPVGRLSNLVFKFRTSSLMSQSSAMTSYSTLIRPRDGHMYETSVTYKSGLFTIDIIEISPARASGRRLPRQDITSCAAI